MQVEDIHDISHTQDSWYRSEQTREQARDHKRDVIPDVRYGCSPDLSSNSPEQTPKDDRSAAQKARKGSEEDGTSKDARNGGGDGVGKLIRGLFIALCDDEVGGLVGDRCGGSGETCPGDDEQNPILLARRPVLEKMCKKCCSRRCAMQYDSDRHLPVDPQAGHSAEE